MCACACVHVCPHTHTPTHIHTHTYSLPHSPLDHDLDIELGSELANVSKASGTPSPSAPPGLGTAFRSPTLSCLQSTNASFKTQRGNLLPRPRPPQRNRLLPTARFPVQLQGRKAILLQLRAGPNSQAPWPACLAEVGPWGGRVSCFSIFRGGACISRARPRPQPALLRASLTCPSASPTRLPSSFPYRDPSDYTRPTRPARGHLPIA